MDQKNGAERKQTARNRHHFMREPKPRCRTIIRCVWRRGNPFSGCKSHTYSYRGCCLISFFSPTPPLFMVFNPSNSVCHFVNPMPPALVVDVILSFISHTTEPSSPFQVSAVDYVAPVIPDSKSSNNSSPSPSPPPSPYRIRFPRQTQRNAEVEVCKLGFPRGEGRAPWIEVPKFPCHFLRDIASSKLSGTPVPS